MDWSKGYSASYYIKVVDPVTWRDTSRIEITGGSIKRVTSGLMQSADLDCIDYPQDIEQWIRIYLDARQGDSGAHVPLFTGLAVSPDRDVRAQKSAMTVQCFSVLKPAADVALLRGWYAQAGSNGASVIQELLSVCPAPITVAPNSPQLSSTIIAEAGETRLSMAEKVLEAIGWHTVINGNGEISVEPYDTTTKAVLDSMDYDVLETSLKVSCDWFSIPNVLMATSDELTAIARDDSPESKLSTVNRGREIWAVETDCNYSDTETLAEYAVRRLNELQRKVTEVSYTRRYIDGIYPLDVIGIYYPGQGLNATYIIESQSISLGHNARTSETVMEV